MDTEITNIPKIIHYCWFGGKKKPDIVKTCIQSWKNILKDYEIIEWNEANFDIHSNTFVKEAYESGKFAFVSDYVRVFVLYHQGGIYLDTDVEVFQSFDKFLHHESFWGFEQENYIATSTIGAKEGNKLIGQFLDSYKSKVFKNEDGSFNELTNVAIVTKILESSGLKRDDSLQIIEGIGAFYPQTYFSPYDYINIRKFITEETVTVHHFYKSWLPTSARVKSTLKKVTARVIGGSNIAKLRSFITK
ncbi:glycosyltransferase family 32 protein [Robertmurraya sp. GLU-23]